MYCKYRGECGREEVVYITEQEGILEVALAIHVFGANILASQALEIRLPPFWNDLLLDSFL